MLPGTIIMLIVIVVGFFGGISETNRMRPMTRHPSSDPLLERSRMWFFDRGDAG